jgi:hypothetical protein
MKKIKAFFNFFTDESFKLRMKQYDIELAEIARQHSRIKKAYALQRIVFDSYGLEYLNYLADPETIIKDNQTITLINYFSPPFTLII